MRIIYKDGSVLEGTEIVIEGNTLFVDGMYTVDFSEVEIILAD